jgi:CheY-like chemotaxis protein
MARIMIVDDDKGLRLLFGKRLASAGHDILYASNGLEAVELAKIHIPELIFLDYQMPIMRGDEALAVIRHSTWGRAIRLVLMSAAVSLNHVPNLSDADQILYKPITGHELQNTVLTIFSN